MQPQTDQHARIVAAAEAVAGRGENPTLTAVRTELGGGSFSTISPVLRAWKAAQAHDDEPVREPLPDRLHEAAIAGAGEIWRAALELAGERLRKRRDLPVTPTPDTTLVDQHGRKYLTADERQRFLAAVRAHPKPTVQTLALTLALTGCRVSEALSIRACDVDLDAAEIRIATLKRRREHWRGVPVPGQALRTRRRTRRTHQRSLRAYGPHGREDGPAMQTALSRTLEFTHAKPEAAHQGTRERTRSTWSSTE